MRQLEQLSVAMTQLGVFLLIALVGFAGARVGWLHTRSVNDYGSLLINICLPCMILGGVHPSENLDIAQFGLIALLAIVQFFMFLSYGAIMNVLLRVPKDKQHTYMFMGICANLGFMGIPILNTIYGSQVVLPASILFVVSSLFFYSVGYALCAEPQPGVKHAIPWKSMLNPCMIVSIIAIIMQLTGVSLPTVLSSATQLVGNVTGPLAMIMVGISMADSTLEDFNLPWQIYPFLLIRQIVIPIISFLVLRALGISPLLVDIFVYFFAMPVGSMCPVFCRVLGLDDVLSARVVVISSLLTVITLPTVVVAMAFL